MNRTSKKLIKREIRHRRVRSVVSGTAERPRLSVFRSLTSIYAQLIDDTKGVTIAQASSKDVKGVTGKTKVAEAVGQQIASKAKAAGVTKAVFDRGGNKYHGRVKALAEGARSAGLEF